MATGAPTAAATTRLVLSDHAEAVMRQIEDLQWTETFSDLTIQVSPSFLVDLHKFNLSDTFYRVPVSRWCGAVPPCYGMRHQSDVEEYSVGTGMR